MSTWSFHNPVHIEFGVAALDRIPDLCPYERAVLITTPGFRRRRTVERIEALLGTRLIKVIDTVKPNPDFDAIDTVVSTLGGLRPDALIALGGGSAIDTAKVVARRLVEPAPAVPVVAVPTTSGTGAEVTPFATVWDFHARKKHSIQGDDLYPRVALLDPELAYGLPPAVTVASGPDAISHGFESTWNRNAGPISLALSARSLLYSLDALPRLVDDPSDHDARGMMMQASTIAGVAIAQTKTALAHSISYPLTSYLELDHGLACSFTLPELLRFNAHSDDGRFQVLVCELGFDGIESLANHLTDLLCRFGAAKALSDIAASVPDLVDQMYTPERAGNNLRAATLDDIRGIVERSIEALNG